MCGLAAFLGSISLTAVASATAKRHRGSRATPASRRRAFRRPICPGANLVPNARNLATVQRATLCLVNRERTASGLRSLANNRALDLVAVAHSLEMVNRDYFSHRSPSGVSARTRILTSGYIRRSAHVAVGETVATAGGQLATPAGVVQGWMSSPEHRSNVLGAGFRASGIGIVLGMPPRAANGWQGAGATYTQDLGSHR
jgi:uncharacterized protein YkwD